ncbi:MAG: 16S rRNA methyltransferase [Candidatus Thorarchaeota archaeon]|nr:MAG: 16S rRNA methyltransferase [Candidatus Thorarchaeota archaeon]
MLHIILLDCALEFVPSEISSMKQVQKHAFRRGKKPTELLLDQTHHGRAMTKLSESERRGRPDITFLSLMSILETPLCKEGLLNVFLHLQDGRIIEVRSDVRLPRNYERFVGLMEQLLLTGRVPPKGDALLHVIDKSLGDLVKDLNAEQTILAIEGGQKTTIHDLTESLPTDTSVPIIVGVGAFPHGDLPDSTTSLFEHKLEFDKDVMMAWHVCAELLWAYSSRVGVVKTRYSVI